MPHLVILYTGQLDAETNMKVLCRDLADAMLTVVDEAGKQVFPTGGTRVLAYPAPHYAVADGGTAGRKAAQFDNNPQKQIQLALELYFDANGGYPTSLSVANLVTPGYIAAIPTDPSNTSVTYDYAALGSGTSCTTYHLGAALETAHSVLNGDSDAAAGTVCTGGGTDFAGTDTVVCAAHTPANTGAKCFDVKP